MITCVSAMDSAASMRMLPIEIARVEWKSVRYARTEKTPQNTSRGCMGDMGGVGGASDKSGAATQRGSDAAARQYYLLNQIKFGIVH